jgi:hypothetical protein
MPRDLNQQIQAFTLHLIESEAEVRPRKNKRSPVEHEKFLLSTGWLYRKLLAVHAAHKGASTRISRDKNRYKAGRYVPEGVTYTIAIEGVLDLMEILGYVEMTNRGRYSRDTGEGDQTRYRPTDAFLKHFEVVSSTLPKQLVGYEDTDPIVLQKRIEREVKDSDGVVTTIPEKKKLPYEDIPKIIRWRDNITIINDCIKRHWVDLYLTDEDCGKLNSQLVEDKDHDYSPIQLRRATLRRVFNSSSFDEGGRFYGAWWHNIPSAYRAFITIDGKFTDEFDYGRIHPTILYADKGIVLVGDAYDIGIGEEHRDIVKQSFNAMVQAKSKLTTPPKKVDWKSTGKTWKELRQLILEKHEPIKDSFFCGMGNKLQFRDSQLAEQIMLHFARRDVPVLPVHDSFIIIRGLYSELVNVMHDEFEKMFHMPINIDDSAKVTPVSFPPENIDVDWIISETDNYEGWTDRNSL